MKAASTNPATEMWLVEDCGHVKAFTRYPAEWLSHVVALLEREIR